MPGATQEHHRLTLATKVTLLRILGIPVFVLLMIYYTLGLRADRPNEFLRVAALAVFVLVALSDALDGYLARSRGEVTALGRMLDPLADKGLLLSAIIVLTRPSLPALRPQLPVWFAGIVVSRDALLIAGAFIVRHFTGSVHIEPRWTGKVSTALQMVCVTWVLADGPSGPVPRLCAVTAGFALAAGVRYVLDGARQLERARANAG